MNPSLQIRGDRRSTLRTTLDRRAYVRTPGRFKDACDKAFSALRKLAAANNKEAK